MTEQGKPEEIRFVALGDSFTEGVGDERPDGGARGWADLVAEGLADTGGTVQYANLAIRGRLLGRIVEEQLEPALALRPAPTLVTFNGGGNDMLRPGTDIAWIARVTERAMHRILDAGAEPVLLAGANPTGGLPGGRGVQGKGDRLVVVARRLADDLGIRFVDNWNDDELRGRQYWSSDRLHLAPVGHRRVAAAVLRSLGRNVPVDWVITADPMPAPRTREQLRYAREHVAPWVHRRLTGRSSGDGRAAKHPGWTPIPPRTAP